ncbi:MAG: multiheme c-type cytochrome [Byssovorax sp.]
MSRRARPLGGAIALSMGLSCCSPAAPITSSPPIAPSATPHAAMPGPAPDPSRGGTARPRADIAAQNDACERCHAAIAAEWRSSLHRGAHTDPIYQRALAIEPLAFCRGCHAPEADPSADPPEALGALGVGCVSCHLAGNNVLAASTSSPRGPAPHPVLRDPRFGGPEACAGCHEFAFPDAALRGRVELMQSTASEHRRSGFASTGCASCHMPETGGHRSHAFLGARDPAAMRAAAKVVAERSGPSTVRLTIASAGVGHALPTGDLFRRLEVSVEAEGPDHQVVSEARRYLTRHFQDERLPRGGIVRSVKRDDRPLDGPIVVELALGPEAAPFPIGYRLAYQRVEHPRSDRAEDALVEGEIELASGVLPPLSR